MHVGRPVGLPESAVTLSEVQNGVYEGTGRCFARFLRCFEVYHDLDHLDVLYSSILLQVGVLNITVHTFRLSSSFEA